MGRKGKRKTQKKHHDNIVDQLTQINARQRPFAAQILAVTAHDRPVPRILPYGAASDIARVLQAACGHFVVSERLDFAVDL